ncbi:MAG: aquaporin Z [Acidimicrobiia bacterium]
MGTLRWKVLVAEMFGTAVLMIGGPGSAVLAAKSIGVLGVALAFGFSLLVMAYVIGPISGCHINPAVTVGMALMKKIKPALVPYYVVGQLVGAAAGGLIVFGIAKGIDGFDATNNFAANGWGEHSPGGYNLAAAIIVEIVLTALLVFVVISTTSKKAPPAQGGIAVGLTLALIHLISIPVDNTSVNPARSFGAAIFAGSDALTQLWAFVVFPIVGAIVGVLVWVAVDDARIGDTVIGDLID